MFAATIALTNASNATAVRSLSWFVAIGSPPLEEEMDMGVGGAQVQVGGGTGPG